mgnify:CR=1 FL=1|tara:strand:+ start:177 stop:665 length:489 start_codon:yes stop_codon:yes gene_type:complete
MVNYENGKIYKIYDNTNGNVYYGSTTQILSKRKNKHKADYNQYKNEKMGRNYKSFDIIENNDYSISLVEEYPCKSKLELEKRERYYIENYECINKQIPTRTLKEWCEENKDKIKKTKDKYRNKDENKNITCQFCSTIIMRKEDIPRHHKTKKCIKFQNNNLS